MATQAITKYDAKDLEALAKVGMKGVDPTDIRPPKVVLIQKSSTLADFVDTEGKNPKVGQFFHTGRLEILESFECYFLMATKGIWIDRRKPDNPEMDQYIAIGVTADDLRPFGMNFRSSSLFALSPLFTAAASNRRPMFSIKCKVETKQLQNEKGEWTIPVVRIVSLVDDAALLTELKGFALSFDAKTEVIAKDEDDPGSVRELEPEQKEVDVNVDGDKPEETEDMPF